MDLVQRDNFKEKFDPRVYLKQRYDKPPDASDNHRGCFLLNIHEELQKISARTTQQDKVTVLDYGCGPVICNIISVAGLSRVSEIILAEYTQRSQEMLGESG